MEKNGHFCPIVPKTSYFAKVWANPFHKQKVLFENGRSQVGSGIPSKTDNLDFSGSASEVVVV